MGSTLGRGLTTSSVRISFGSIYSSNLKMIFWPVILPPPKCSVGFGGVALSNTGGIVSLGPPDGGTILAHPECPMAPMMSREKKAKINRPFWSFIFYKHSGFTPQKNVISFPLRQLHARRQPGYWS